LQRLAEALRKLNRKRKARIATKVPRAAVERRLATKKLQALKKSFRGKPE
jgi:hypothetical protein